MESEVGRCTSDKQRDHFVQLHELVPDLERDRLDRQRLFRGVQVIELPGRCFACGAECVTRMHNTHIPFFKEVIIMSNACEVCGYRNSEVKPGGGFSDHGTQITLQVRA